MTTEDLLDHYRYPRNFGSLPAPDVVHEDVNPGCGDRIRIEVELDDTMTLERIHFVGDGCTISVATASLLTTLLKGRSLQEALHFSESALLQTLDFSLSPRRHSCALLGLRVLRAGLIRYYHDQRLAQEAGGSA